MGLLAHQRQQLLIQPQGYTVLLPVGGRYLDLPIFALQRMGSNTCLWLSPGAELIVSDNYADFTQAVALSRAECSDRAFLYAQDAENISICGGVPGCRLSGAASLPPALS